MSSSLCQGSDEEVLCASLFHLVQDEDRTAMLREALGGFCHHCRNVLNGMKMGLFFVRRSTVGPLPPSWTDLERSYQAVETLFERLQAIYRPMPLTQVRAPFLSLVKERRPLWEELTVRAGMLLRIEPPAVEPLVEFDPTRLGSAMDALVEWRASILVPNQRVRLGWQSMEGDIEVRWEEDSCPRAPANPFCPVDHRDEFTSGRSLALPLLARVMTAHGGRLDWSRSNGYDIVLRWPREAPKKPREAAD